MRFRRAALLTVLCGALVATLVVQGTANAAASSHVYENNNRWAGYSYQSPQAVVQGAYSSWVVPTIYCPPSGTFQMSQWVGAGNSAYNDTLYQTGIESTCVNGTAVYKPFWEQVPGNTAQHWANAVHPGDHVTAHAALHLINGNGVGAWNLNIEDYGSSTWTTSKWVASVDAPKTVTRASYWGECIVERPSYLSGNQVKQYNLADFGLAAFLHVNTNDFGTLSDGCDVGIPGRYSLSTASTAPVPWSGTIYRSDIASSTGKKLAVTSAPSSNGYFTVAWKASS